MKRARTPQKRYGGVGPDTYYRRIGHTKVAALRILGPSIIAFFGYLALFYGSELSPRHSEIFLKPLNRLYPILRVPILRPLGRSIFAGDAVQL